MKQSLRLVMLALVMVATPFVVHAQYKVQAGDNLWTLAGKNLQDPSAWEKIYSANPFLQEPGRRFERNGETIVVLRPGETLFGLNAVGVVQTPAKIGPADLASETKQPVKEVIVSNKLPPWFWVLLACIAFLIFAWWLISRSFEEAKRVAEAELNKDPVTSGPPVVPGGVTDATAPAQFQAMAARMYTEQTGRTATSIQMFEIIRSTVGRIWGKLFVRYHDGNEELRLCNGQRAYEAEVRFPDGAVETLYMLQGCGNDLRYGGVNRYHPAEGFRFEPDPVVPAPAAVPVTEAVRATVVEPVPTSDHTPIEDGVVKLEVRAATGDQPAMIRMTGVDETSDNTCEIKEGSIVLRFTPRRSVK